MATTLTRWRDNVFAPLDWSNGLLPMFLPEIRVEQVVEEDRYLVRAELPGIDPKDVDLTVLNGVLKIRAERTAEQRDKAHSEFHYGRLVRNVVLPAGVLEDSGAAIYRDGMLEISFKMGEIKEPGRHIAIEVPKAK